MQINRLHNEQYGTSRGPEAWQWEFMNGPYGKSIFIVAEHKGEIIGTQALLPIALSYGEQKILSAKSEETLLRVEYRGQGILKRLYDACFKLAVKKGIALVWGFTYAERPLRKCGFEFPSRLNHLILILNPSKANKMTGSRFTAQVRKRVGSYIVQKLLFRVFTLIGFLWYKGRNLKINASSRFKVALITVVDARLDVFWEAFREKKDFYTIDRNSAYLDWRIFKNPNLTYQILAVIYNDKIQGYIVIGRSKIVNLGYITDLCVLDEYSEEVSRLLVSHAIACLHDQGVCYIDAWCVGNSPQTKQYSSYLIKSGFLPVPRASYVVMKVLSGEGNLPVDPYLLNQWFITEIFSEGAG